MGRIAGEMDVGVGVPHTDIHFACVFHEAEQILVNDILVLWDTTTKFPKELIFYKRTKPKVVVQLGYKCAGGKPGNHPIFPGCPKHLGRRKSVQ